MNCQAERVPLGKCRCKRCTDVRVAGRRIGAYWAQKMNEKLLECWREANAAKETQMSKPKYDYSKCKRSTLENLAEAVMKTWFPSGSIQSDVLKVVREEARVKTLAEYDAEIGELVRHGTGTDLTFSLNAEYWDKLKRLADQSKSAKDTASF